MRVRVVPVLSWMLKLGISQERTEYLQIFLFLQPFINKFFPLELQTIPSKVYAANRNAD